MLADMRQLFPSSSEATLASVLDDLRTHATGLGLAALVAGVWIGASFWGALDTAFCRIYHMRCRTWWEQKRFALVMLAVVLVFLVATVAIPTVQSILVRRRDLAAVRPRQRAHGRVRGDAGGRRRGRCSARFA